MRMNVLTVLTRTAAACLLVAAGSRIAISQETKRKLSPLTPRESLAAVKVADGYQLELVAAEPNVIDPVAIRFDARGRMWVAEMRDYPHGPEPGQPPHSTIKILEDRDGDGFFETSQVFADQLLFANGIQPWRSGVIATVGGRVVYMPDDDDDGKADRIETWFEGFAQQNSQLRANHPTLAIDNQVYVANGLRGGKVVDARKENAKAVSISGMDFRFDPLRGDYEAVSGVGQFGLTFDDDGRRFVCSNRNPVKHIVMPNHYLRRNPSAPPTQVANDVAKAGPESRLYPLSRAWTTSTLHANQFTAACGVTIYSGDRISSLQGSVFTCDPTGNLVHREIMRSTGGSFVSKPARDGAEFIASSDEWFRPVNLSNGPDGCLYVVDMYRAVIEHPQFVPEELKKRPDQRYGDDLGRIYRLRPTGDAGNSASPPAFLPLAKLSIADLTPQLNSPNGWTRETAARLLLQQQDPSLESALRTQLTSGTPRGWARSLWLLHNLGKLSDADVANALQSDSPHVQLQALKLSESRPTLRTAVRRLASSQSSPVRFQVALSLTPAEPDDVDALAAIAVSGAADRWTEEAVALSGGQQIEPLAASVLDRLLQAKSLDDPASLSLAARLVELAAKQQPKSTPLLQSLAEMENGPAAQRLAYAMIRGAARGKVSFAQLKDANEDFGKAVQAILASAESTAADSASPRAARDTAIGLLSVSVGANPGSLTMLTKLAEGENADQATRLSAINALIHVNNDDLAAALIERSPSESPAIRRAIMDHALARSSRIVRLLDAIEAGSIKVAEIDRVRTNRLLAIKTDPLRTRIRKAFADAIPEDRKKVLTQYQTVLTLDANPNRGELIFRKNCATCHRVGKWGVDVAPDIADSRTRKKTQLLTDILQPNRAIDSNYVSYTVHAADGRTLTGIIDVETSDSVSLKLAEGKRVTLPRSEIEAMRSNGVSLMPEGLEKNIDHQQMADLISYIKNWRYLDGKTPYVE